MNKPILIFILFIVFLFLVDGCHERNSLNPNKVCKHHDGVQRIYETSNSNITAVICRDGYWKKS